MSNDVKRAYFYAPSTREVYIRIHKEDLEDGDEDKVGMLNLSLYGTRDAALNWVKTHTDNFLQVSDHLLLRKTIQLTGNLNTSQPAPTKKRNNKISLINTKDTTIKRILQTNLRPRRPFIIAA